MSDMLVQPSQIKAEKSLSNSVFLEQSYAQSGSFGKFYHTTVLCSSNRKPDLIVCSTLLATGDRLDINILETSRIQVATGMKRRDEAHVKEVFMAHSRNLSGRFSPVRPCSCSEPLIHGKEYLRSALELLKVSVRNEHEFEEVFREVSFKSQYVPSPSPSPSPSSSSGFCSLPPSPGLPPSLCLSLALPLPRPLPRPIPRPLTQSISLLPFPPPLRTLHSHSRDLDVPYILLGRPRLPPSLHLCSSLLPSYLLYLPPSLPRSRLSICPSYPSTVHPLRAVYCILTRAGSQSKLRTHPL